MKRTYIFATLLIAFSTLPSYCQEEMMIIPAGSFQMGKNVDREANYTPLHKVIIDSFLLDKNEVTNAQYAEFCKNTGHRLPEFWNTDVFRCGDNFPNHPVIGISWSDAMKYAQWAEKRLPTEAEWEYAARGGLIDNDFPNGNEWTQEIRRNTEGTWQNLIIEVATFDSNAFGLYDMAGNVWEWVMDGYLPDYYSNSEVNNPKGPKKGVGRVIRGGSWHSGKMCHRVYFRKGLTANWVDFAVGFRCAKDL